MIEISKELNYVLQNAQNRAKHLGHEYLTLEHIFQSLLENPTIIKALQECGGNIQTIKSQIERYLLHFLQPYSNSNETPMETLAVTRVIEIMISHVKGSQRKEAQVGDLLAAILEEDKAFCTQVLKAQGITRLNILEYITENIQSLQTPKNKNENQQESILEKYCINLTKEAKEGRTDPIIGRDAEIERCLEVLLRRKKIILF